MIRGTGSGGSRVGVLRTPTVGLVVVAACLASMVAAARGSTPPPRPATGRAQQVPVVSATVVCPAPLGGLDITSRVAVAQPFTAPGPATVTRSFLGDRGGTSGVGAPGRVVVTDTKSPTRPLVFTATGSAAPGFAASQTTRSSSGELRGWSSTPCTQSGTDFWFVGSGSVAGHHGLLILSNAESTPAQVDLTLYRESGVLEAGAQTRLLVPAGTQRGVRLEELAPDQPYLAVHVQVRAGRLAATLRDSEMRGTVPRGADWLQPSVEPSRSVLIPGVPGRLGARYLRIVAPGDAATVAVRLITGEHTYTPTGLEAVQVPAAGITEVNLTDVTAGEPVGVQIESDVPVTAGVMSRLGSGTTLLELAHSAAVIPLDGPAVVPDVRDQGAVESSLVLSAPEADAAVRVDVLVAPGLAQPGSRTVRVPAGTTVSVPLHATTMVASFGIVVTPLQGSGPVVGVRTISEVGVRGPLLTTSPLVSARTTVRVPTVVPDLTAGLRGR